MSSAKPFVISKDRVVKAFELVKANAGAAGVDEQSLEEFGENLKANLYKIWNRMSSGIVGHDENDIRPDSHPAAGPDQPRQGQPGGAQTHGFQKVATRVVKLTHIYCPLA